MAKRDIRLLLDNIRSVHNVGSIFRTAETLGVRHIYCVGTTPLPVDRFGGKRGDFAKVALGAENMVEWEYAVNGPAIAKKLKKEKFKVIALEQADASKDYKKVRPGSKALIILGAEVTGVSPELQKLADVVAEIPLLGKKESLNVSVAAGIFLYRMLDE
jgi:tRNA G18 (ribose-2'-O)-methylase SpoU